MEVAMRVVLLACACVGLIACDASEMGIDAGRELDGGGSDAGVIEEDAGPLQLDAGVDAGECECAGATECCDGCHPINSGESCTMPATATVPPATCTNGLCIGQPCECSSGPCCDGCMFRPSTHQCATGVVYATECNDSLSEACPGYSNRIWESVGNQFCTGSDAECSGRVDHASTRGRDCYSSETPVFCIEDGAAPLVARCGHTCEAR